MAPLNKATIKADKEAQLAEARDRDDGVVDAGDRDLSARATEVPGDTDVPAAEPHLSDRTDPETGRPAIVGRRDATREAIARRFQGNRETADGMVDPSLPAELQQMTAAETADAAVDAGEGGDADTGQSDTGQAEPGADARKFVVRGKEVVLTQDEVDRLVMRGLATEDYMDEVKTELGRAKVLREQLEGQVSGPRTTQDGKRPPAPDGTHAEATGDADTDGRPDPFEMVTKKIAYGEDGAGQDLRTAVEAIVDARSGQKTAEQIENDRRANDQAVAQAVLAAFAKQHPEIASDRKASGAMASAYRDEFEKDLAAVGFTLDKMKETLEGRDPTDNDIAGFHHWFRSRPAPQPGIRTFADVTAAAYEGYKDWRGDTAKPTPREGRPVVKLDTVTRNERRANITQQPQRQGPAAVAQPDQPEPRRDPSKVIDGMRSRTQGRDLRPRFERVTAR